MLFHQFLRLKVFVIWCFYQFKFLKVIKPGWWNLEVQQSVIMQTAFTLLTSTFVDKKRKVTSFDWILIREHSLFMAGGGGWQDLSRTLAKTPNPLKFSYKIPLMIPQKQMLENHSPPPPPKVKKEMQKWVQFLLFQCFIFGTCKNLQTNSATKI